jgi:hypothetical protein
MTKPASELRQFCEHLAPGGEKHFTRPEALRCLHGPHGGRTMEPPLWDELDAPTEIEAR